jgi:hypothetical protein
MPSSQSTVETLILTMLKSGRLTLTEVHIEATQFLLTHFNFQLINSFLINSSKIIYITDCFYGQTEKKNLIFGER